MRLASHQLNVVAGIEKNQSTPQCFHSSRHCCKFSLQFRYGLRVSVRLDEVRAEKVEAQAVAIGKVRAGAIERYANHAGAARRQCNRQLVLDSQQAVKLIV